MLVIIPTLGVGGAEIDLVRTLPNIDRLRFEVVVCAFLAGGSLAQPLVDAGIEVFGPIRQPSPRADRRRLLRILPFSLIGPLLATAWAYLGFGRAVAGYVREAEIDVVHAILPNAYLVGAIACMLAKRPGLVMSRVSLNWYQQENRILATIERRVLHHRVAAVICNSQAIFAELLHEGVSAAKIRLIRNGIDLQAFSERQVNREEIRDRFGVSRASLVFSNVGNFHPYKGHVDLLHALQVIRDRLPPNFVLLAAGGDVDGNLAKMRELSDRLGLSSHVRFLGQRDDVGDLLQIADIHVSSSHTEGFPNNILEAMCVGLPVVATAVGGTPEMVVDGLTGLLVPARNVEEMARAVLQLADDPDMRRSMGEAGRTRVEAHFSIKRSVEALEAIYEAVADDRP